jgi:ribosomal protein L29
MKIKELKLKSENELKTLLNDSREKLREMRFKVAQRQLKNVREVRKTKELVARIMTLMKEKEKAIKS